MKIIKTIKGIIANDNNMRQTDITVHFTADSRGKTLSLECIGIMLIVPFEQVEKIIEGVRRK